MPAWLPGVFALAAVTGIVGAIVGAIELRRRRSRAMPCSLMSLMSLLAVIAQVMLSPALRSALAMVTPAHPGFRCFRSSRHSRIGYERLDGGEPEPLPVVNLAHVRENGPLAFNAPARVAGAEPQLRVTLCRCGQSNNKPYCDNSHKAAGFAATGEPADAASDPLPARAGELDVTPTKNGPLHVQGSLEIVSGTGRTLGRVQETWLCRCGHSQNKPYCDGSHAKAGFEADGA